MADNGGVQPRLVNRQRELELVRNAMSDVTEGRGRVVLLAGEAGIGRTRLAEEAAALAREQGWEVAWGKCSLGEEAPPYGPWLSVLRASAGEGAAPALIDELIGTLKGDSAPDEQRLLRHHEVLETLIPAAEAPPRMLLFDDLHAADEASLSLLRFVVQAIPGERVLVLGTYREDALERGSAAARALSAIVHEGSLMTMSGLSEDETVTLFEAMCAQPPPPAISAAVYDATAGNPFFVQEIARQTAATGELRRPDLSVGFAVPSRIQELFAQRLAAVPPDVAETLAVAAVIGRQFDLPTLEAVTEVAAQELVSRLDLAHGAGLVVESSVGRYQFPHVMIRETLYESLGAPVRMKLHHRIGVALEGLHAADLDAHLGELAHHFFKAGHLGDLDKALDYARRAAAAAQAIGARDEEIRHRYRGLRIAEAAGADPGARSKLAEGLASARARAGKADGLAEPPEEPVSAFVREGEYWTVAFGGQVARLKDSKGMGMLARLLAEPAREFHAIDLAGEAPPPAQGVGPDAAEVPLVDPGDAGPVLDEEAKRAYRARLHDLEEDLREAEDFNDAERASQLRQEIEFLAHELATAVGIGGRDRKAASASERARVSATRAIRSAIKRMEEEIPELAEHLNVTVRTGTFLSYVPDPRLRADWRT